MNNMQRKQPIRDRNAQTHMPPMATPRRAQQGKKPGCLALLFVFGIIGGLVWLMMLLMGWGPYAAGEFQTTPTQTLIPVIVLRGTSTHTPTSVVSAAVTPTDSPPQTPTLAPSPLPSPTLELMPFIVIGEQETLSSALIRPGLGCDKLIIAGQVWNLQDAPVKGLRLHLTGEWGGFIVDSFATTGSAANYGESGYEFTLENLLLSSDETVFIQLFDANENPLSHPYPIQTFDDCQKNLILINFKQVR